jgi:hypothetical protein
MNPRLRNYLLFESYSLATSYAFTEFGVEKTIAEYELDSPKVVFRYFIRYLHVLVNNLIASFRMQKLFIILRHYNSSSSASFLADIAEVNQF